MWLRYRVFIGILASLLVLSGCVGATLLVGGANAGCSTNSYGTVKCGPGDCAANSYGTVKCSKHVAGGAAVNSYGTVRCGIGKCGVNSYGTVKCSPVAGGGAGVNSYGTVVCSDVGGDSVSCEDGSENNCEDGK